MPENDRTSLTVGSLLGLPLGTLRPQPPASAAPAEGAGASAAEEIEGPNWTIDGGEASHSGARRAWRADGVEALNFNNPFGQVMERVWFDGKVVFAVDLGRVDVDTAKVKVAQEYQVIYGVQLDEQGRSIGEPDMVPGQLNIYDTVPGMDRYSPIWQFNYVIVPRDYEPNTLRSEGDCLASGYQIHRSQNFEN